jgi:hypothetical protein
MVELAESEEILLIGRDLMAPALHDGRLAANGLRRPKSAGGPAPRFIATG